MFIIFDNICEKGDENMPWNEIKNQIEVDSFNECFGYFHDSCLKELWFSTGGYVNKDYRMNPISNPIARLIFQRQSEQLSIIEIEFKDVIQINVRPVPINYGVDIIQTHMYFENGVFFLSDKDYEYSENGKDKSTWIAAKKVRWRKIDNGLGKNNYYIVD
jgi:hypothetical protein